MSKELHIYHAGSTKSIVEKAAKEYKLVDPEISLNLHAMGSVECINRVQRGYVADLLVLADYSLIEKLLFPWFTDWYVLFAANRMVLTAPKGKKIPDRHWSELLCNPLVRFGYTDPEKDPCGYRTLMVLKLADKHFPGLYQLLITHPGRVVYPGPEPMLNDLALGNIDFAFEYGSVAEEHKLTIIELESLYNLSDPQKQDHYSGVSFSLGPNKEVQGSAIAYALTIPKQSLNQKEALDFARLLLKVDLTVYGLRPIYQTEGDAPLSQD